MVAGWHYWVFRAGNAGNPELVPDIALVVGVPSHSGEQWNPSAEPFRFGMSLARRRRSIAGEALESDGNTFQITGDGRFENAITLNDFDFFDGVGTTHRGSLQALLEAPSISHDFRYYSGSLAIASRTQIA